MKQVSHIDIDLEKETVSRWKKYVDILTSGTGRIEKNKKIRDERIDVTGKKEKIDWMVAKGKKKQLNESGKKIKKRGHTWTGRIKKKEKTYE